MRADVCEVDERHGSVWMAAMAGLVVLVGASPLDWKVYVPRRQKVDIVFGSAQISPASL